MSSRGKKVGEKKQKKGGKGGQLNGGGALGKVEWGEGGRDNEKGK